MRYLKMLLSLLFLVTALFLYGQGEEVPAPIKEDWSMDNLLTWTNALFMALSVLTGYVSAWIPGLKKITNTQWRVTVGASIIATLFISFGFSDIISTVISYFTATNLYSHILELFKKTPKPAPEPIDA